MADLHQKKDSHISLAAHHGMEWHLSTADDPTDGPVGQHVFIKVPAFRTSADGEAKRYRQTGKPFVENAPIANGKQAVKAAPPVPKNKYGAEVERANSEE